MFVGGYMFSNVGEKNHKTGAKYFMPLMIDLVRVLHAEIVIGNDRFEELNPCVVYDFYQ